MSKKLLVRINELFPQLPNLQDRINQSPLFKSQCESLQVGLELFLHLGKIDFVENGKQERKGENRYNKMLAFSDKMLVLDAYLSMQAEYTDLLLNNWLNANPHAYEVAYQYQNIWAKMVNAEKGEVSVYNENFFRNLNNYALAWSLIEDGVETQNGTIADIEVAAQQTKNFICALAPIAIKMMAKIRIIFFITAIN